MESHVLSCQNQTDYNMFKHILTMFYGQLMINYVLNVL